MEKSSQKQLTKHCQASLKAINADLESAQKQIKVLIQGDDRLKELFAWITSVPGVGDAIAAEVLVATAGRPRNEFKAINDPKKLACHAGVAPFEYRSGSSVRGKTRVSQHARLRLKSLFHLGAMSAIRMKAGRPVPRIAKLLPAQGWRGQEQNAGTECCSQQWDRPRGSFTAFVQ